MQILSLERWKFAEAELVPSNEGRMCAIAMRDGDAPPGSWAALWIEGHRRDLRDPIGSTGLVSGGGEQRGTAGAVLRAEIGSRTGS